MLYAYYDDTIDAGVCQVDFGYYIDDAASLAVALVNTEDVVRGQDQLASRPGLVTFAEEHDLPDMDDEDQRVLVDARSRLRAVFRSAPAGGTKEQLNSLLGDYASAPRLVDDPADQGIHLHFEPADAEPGHWVAATATIGLALLVAQAGADRLGLCRSSSCQRAYLDRSKNRGKLFCSASCARRASVTAFRERQRRAQSVER